jgi:hypothetical protein
MDEVRTFLGEWDRMIEQNTKEITTLVRCENENCGGVCFAGEVEQRDWKCPYSGRPISKLD